MPTRHRNDRRPAIPLRNRRLHQLAHHRHGSNQPEHRRSNLDQQASHNKSPGEASLNKPERWSLEFTLGYQAGFSKGMEVHHKSLQTLRQAQREFDEALDSALESGNSQVIAELDKQILQRIENGDTPNRS